MRSVRTLSTWLALCFASICMADEPIERDDGVAVEIETAPPVRDPVGAWAVVHAAMPPDHLVRRIAIAMHGVNLLHAPANDAPTLVTFTGWIDGHYDAKDTQPYEGGPYTAPGVDAAQIAPALDALLASRQWQQYWRSLDSLILECSADKVYWWLFPVPEGGFQEGVTFPTVRVPFEP